ncbi:BZ3500_MvSof-1268-A1-R1_Chr4-2g07134 [Microbotryum saponariae]|uniref:BZ3500_MvSof-1268-A1-R1_Chr4-2g07134 protein n=1 Tax=Microbotryum saponariae TaxID=289078 RepID=A0A2X0KXY0_9BASI|nr:BZ3500_MvSof-1268-A1-R1_Chr4-2g07134 [Microbotryum saponariae]SDA06799.1 BZ3501_MvSof-1269-A2-R1_Chr4-2g06845 [Microbotryum saponariae]
MSYKATRPLVAPPDANSIRTTVVPAAEFPNWLASQRATINWQRHKSQSYKSKALIEGQANQPPNPDTRLKGQHRKVMFEQYICNWAGSPRPVAESMRKRIRKSSIKCGCKAAITVSYYRDNPTIYHVVITPHNNHDPYSSEYLLRSRLSAPIQLWLSEVASKGLDWSTLKLMQLSEEEMRTIGDLGSSPTVPEILRVRYRDVYNKVRQNMPSQSPRASAARENVNA